MTKKDCSRCASGLARNCEISLKRHLQEDVETEVQRRLEAFKTDPEFWNGVEEDLRQVFENHLEEAVDVEFEEELGRIVDEEEEKRIEEEQVED
jgi:hypothetical protein